MKTVLNTAKLLLLVLVAAATIVGYGFFRVWQVNELPKVERVAWQADIVDLGRQAVLELDIRAPWHRELASAKPTQLPDALVAAAASEGSLTRGPLGWTGHRSWSLTIPVVAVAAALEEDKTIKLPLVPIRRSAPNSIYADLPPLAVQMPEDVPQEPHNPLDLLTADAPPPPDPETEIVPTPGPSPWPIIIAAPLAAVALTLALRFLRRPKPVVPAWDIAHAHLDRLRHEFGLSPDHYFSRLTDILKQYTVSRFGGNATAASSTEFIASLDDVPNLPGEHQTSLTTVVRKADAVKFAGAAAGSDAANLALESVRTFVIATTPDLDDA